MATIWWPCCQALLRGALWPRMQSLKPVGLREWQDNSLANGLAAKFLHGPTTLLQRPGPEQMQVVGLIDRLLPDEKS